MKEDLSQALASTTLDKEETPFRGFFNKTAVKTQLKKYLPELFDTPNSLADGLFSSDERIYISAVNEREIGYSFNHCQLGDTQYPLIELTVTHLHLMQIHSEELIYAVNPFIDEGKGIVSTEHPYAYRGWRVHVLMGSPFVNQKDPQMLQLEWTGKDQFGKSETLQVAYMDMFGNGQRMILDVQNQTISLPHIHETFDMKTTDEFVTKQQNQPFIFDAVSVEDACAGISFHGNEANRIGQQHLQLPLTMHAFYPG